MATTMQPSSELGQWEPLGVNGAAWKNEQCAFRILFHNGRYRVSNKPTTYDSFELCEQRAWKHHRKLLAESRDIVARFGHQS